MCHGGFRSLVACELTCLVRALRAPSHPSTIDRFIINPFSHHQFAPLAIDRFFILLAGCASHLSFCFVSFVCGVCVHQISIIAILLVASAHFMGVNTSFILAIMLALSWLTSRAPFGTTVSSLGAFLGTT